MMKLWIRGRGLDSLELDSPLAEPLEEGSAADLYCYAQILMI